MAKLADLLYHRSGLLGLSGSSGDMQQLLADDRPQARQAIDYFVPHTRLAIGSLVVVLGWLGIELNAVQNQSNARFISPADARVPLCVIATDEERVIARHTLALLRVEVNG